MSGMTLWDAKEVRKTIEEMEHPLIAKEVKED